MKRFLLNVLFVLPVLLLPSCFNSKPSNTSISSSYHYSRPSFEEPTELMMDLTLPDSDVEPSVLLTNVTYEINVYSPDRLSFYFRDVKISTSSTASVAPPRKHSGDDRDNWIYFLFYLKKLEVNDDFVITLTYKDFCLEKHYQVVNNTTEAKVTYQQKNRWKFEEESYLFTSQEEYYSVFTEADSGYVKYGKAFFENHYLFVAHLGISHYNSISISFNSAFVVHDRTSM